MKLQITCNTLTNRHAYTPEYICICTCRIFCRVTIITNPTLGPTFMMQPGMLTCFITLSFFVSLVYIVSMYTVCRIICLKCVTLNIYSNGFQWKVPLFVMFYKRIYNVHGYVENTIERIKMLLEEITWPCPGLKSKLSIL